MIKNITFFLFILPLFISAQEDAWVYFADKANVQDALNNPSSILTQRALDRKARHNVAIAESDVPVNQNYLDQIKASNGITVLAKSKWLNCVHVRGTQEDITALFNMSFVNLIDFANKNLTSIKRNSQIVNDKFNIEEEQVTFNYGNATNQVEMIGVDDLHEADYTGEGMLIAVMDSDFPNVDTMGGFQRLRDNGDLLGGYDFVDGTDDVYAFFGSSHGTLVLSAMAGFIQDQYVGTAPDASYVLFRTEDVSVENPVEESYWVEAAERADSLGVDIINTSLGYKTGFTNPNYDYTDADMDGLTAFITQGANVAFEKGMLLVTSAGNSGVNGIGAPADSATTISVGAVDSNGTIASFSSQGNNFQPIIKPDISAQGAGSALISASNTLVSANGTSFSSPIMAGALASLWSANPSLTNAQIKQFLLDVGSQANNPDTALGYGIPNMATALSNVLNVADNDQTQISIFPNPTSDRLFVTTTSENLQVYIYNMLGQQIATTSVSQEQPFIDVASFSKGIYVINLKTSQSTTTFRFIKN